MLIDKGVVFLIHKVACKLFRLRCTIHKLIYFYIFEDIPRQCLNSSLIHNFNAQMFLISSSALIYLCTLRSKSMTSCYIFMRTQKDLMANNDVFCIIMLHALVKWHLHHINITWSHVFSKKHNFRWHV